MGPVGLTPSFPLTTAPGRAPVVSLEAARLRQVASTLQEMKPYFLSQGVDRQTIDKGLAESASWEEMAALVLEGLLSQYVADNYSLDSRNPRISQLVQLLRRHDPMREAVLEIMRSHDRYDPLKIPVGALLILR